jgi:hypothetical protein
MATDTSATHEPLVEDFRMDLSAAEIAAARAAHTRALALDSYTHGLPAFLHMRQLTELIQANRMLSPGSFPLGTWMLVRKLSDPSTNTRMPNVDTLYGAAYLLLDQQGPFVLSVPPIADRYYSVALIDAYFNNFAIVSPRTFGNDGGDYLLVPPGWSGEAPAGVRAVFEAPTPNVALYQRIFIRDEGEYATLHRLQDAITLTPLAQWGQPERGPLPEADLAPYAIPAMRATSDPLQYFAYVNFYRQVNPPPVEERGLMDLFRTAGVGPGSALPENPALRAAIVEGAAQAQALINARISEGPFRNGWRVPDPHIGRAGPFILSRAAFQLTQIGSFTAEEAIYFFGFRDADDRVLHGDHRYTLTFPAGQLPPLARYGFWSVTMYGADNLLVANAANRYCVRPDTPGLAYGPDGSLTIAIQAERPADGPAANWLPAPRGVFVLGLRAYQPTAPILDGTWFPPAPRRLG